MEWIVLPVAGVLGLMAISSLKNVEEYGDFDPAVLKGTDYKRIDTRSHLPDIRSPGMDFKAYRQPSNTKSFKKGVSIEQASRNIF